MKIKELINQLSDYDPEDDVELMYSYYTLSAENNSLNVLQVENNFTVLKQGAANTVLLATNQSLTE